MLVITQHRRRQYLRLGQTTIRAPAHEFRRVTGVVESRLPGVAANSDVFQIAPQRSLQTAIDAFRHGIDIGHVGIPAHQITPGKETESEHLPASELKRSYSGRPSNTFGNALGNSIVGAIQFSNQQERLRSSLDRAGISYTVDADGRPQADPRQRASFDFVTGAVQGGATDDQIAAGLPKLSDSLAALNQAPGLLDQDEITQRVAAATNGQELSLDGVTEIIVEMGRPSGSRIIEDTVIGGAKLLSAANQLLQEDAPLATALYGGLKAVLGGGPVKTVALQIAKLAEGDLVNRLAGEAGNFARDAARPVAFSFAEAQGLELNANIAGQEVNFGSQDFAEVAGEFAGGVAETIVGGTIQGIANRGVSVNNVVSRARGSNNPNTKQSAQIGQEAHRQIQVERAGEYVPEQRITLPNGQLVRKDGVGIDNPGKVLIIKPGTPTGTAAAQKRADLMQGYGYETEVQLYDPTDPRYLPGSSTYIGPR